MCAVLNACRMIGDNANCDYSFAIRQEDSCDSKEQKCEGSLRKTVELSGGIPDTQTEEVFKTASEQRNSGTSGRRITVNWKTSKSSHNCLLSLFLLFLLFSLSIPCPIKCISGTQVPEWQRTSHPFHIYSLWLEPWTSLKCFLNFSPFCSILIPIPYFLGRNSDWPSYDPINDRQWQGCNASFLLPRDNPCGHCEVPDTLENVGHN